MRSNNLKTVITKDLPTMNYVEGKTRGSTGIRLRDYCVLGTLFAIIMALLSPPYLEFSLRKLMEDNLDSEESLLVEDIRSFVDGADSDRSRPLLGPADSNEADSSPRKVPTDGDIACEQNVRNCIEQVAVDNEAADKEALMGGDTRLSERDEDLKIVQFDAQSPVKGEDSAESEESGSQSKAIVQLEETKTADSATQNDTAVTGQDSDQEIERQADITLERTEGQEEQEGTEASPNNGDVAEEEIPVLMDTATTTTHEIPVEKLQLSDAAETKSTNSTNAKGKCNISAGKWIPDPMGPLYRFNECRILSAAQNCQRNGRPDHQYESYRWEPEQCSIPRFDPLAFLELMRGKTIAFVGDSLARNQMESLMCMLMQVEQPRSKGNKNMHRWYFGSHKFTVIRMWSSWLVQTNGDFPPSLAPKDAKNLNLTELDDYAYHLPKFDVTILSSGHWWLRKTAFFVGGEMLGGAGWPWNPKVHGEQKINHVKAFDIAVNTALSKIGSYPGYKGLTILRTYTPDHYSGGSWDTGGSCTGETAPYGTAPANTYNEMMYNKQLKAFKGNTKGGEIMPNGSKLKLLDVYPVLNYRGDGHPGPYRNNDPNKRTTRDAKGNPPPQDCLHWCMPGPVDTMNEMLFEVLKDEFQKR